MHSSSGRYGADRQLRLIAGGLTRGRYEAVVVLPRDGPLVADLQADGIEVLIQPLSVLRRELMSARGLASLAVGAGRDARAVGRLARRRHVSLVHSNTSVVLSGAAAAAAAGIPHVWHVREIYARFARAWPLYRSLLSTAARLPCVSRAAAAQFRPSDPVRVIADALALDLTRGPQGAARTELGLPHDVPVIGLVGRISDWKGHDVLVRALAEPPLAGIGAIGLFAGEAWPGAEQRMSKVLELAAALEVTNRLHLVGFRDDVSAVYAAADLIAVPSTMPDPLPGAAVEAAAAGCVVIGSAIGGIPEVIVDRVTGRLVAPGDPAALARVARELLDDPAQRDRLGAAAAGDVRRRFSRTALLGGLQALYDSVLGIGG